MSLGEVGLSKDSPLLLFSTAEERGAECPSAATQDEAGISSGFEGPDPLSGIVFTTLSGIK